MRVWVSGGGGFLGSNIVDVAVRAGHEVLTTAHTFVAPGDAPYQVESVDMTNASQVDASIAAFAPDVMIHNAIMNDWDQMYGDRHAAWAAYVDATRNTVTSANKVGAHSVLVSTDWVFDGTQGGADESTPPNPVNLYGVLKVASEIVSLELGAAVARVSGVQGMHLARPATPRAQDRGYGYLVASLVDALESRREFTVWEAPEINMRATPSYAPECAELMLAIGERRVGGVFHLCGADAVDRRGLALKTCEVFGLDASLLRFGPPDPESNANAPIPHDSSIVAPRTAELLNHATTPLASLLERFARDRRALVGKDEGS